MPERADEPPFITYLTYRGDDGTIITVTAPWAEVDIIPPPSISFVDSITKRTIVYNYESSSGY